MVARWIAALCLGASLLLAASDGRGAAPQPPSIDDFLSEASISAPSLSPSGRYVAFVKFAADKRVVVVFDLETKQAKALFAGPVSDGVYFTWTRWKDDSRLLVGAEVVDIERRKGGEGSVRSVRYGGEIIAVNRDGTNRVELLKDAPDINSAAVYRGSILDNLRGDPRHVLISSWTKGGVRGVWRVDVDTGKGELIERGARTTSSWVTDSQGRIVGRWDASAAMGGWIALSARTAGTDAYVEVVRVKPRDLEGIQDYTILGAAPGDARVYVLVEPKTYENGDTAAIHIYDLRAKSLGPVVWRNAGHDVEGLIVDSETLEFRGGCYTDDVYRCEFADRAAQATYKGLSDFFDNERSITPVSWSQTDRKTIYLVSGPDEPASYYLYDWDKKHIEVLGSAAPQLPAASLGRMRKVTWKSRDGFDLSGYLTLPPGAPAGVKLPLVVMPHGGPEVRDSFAYDRWGQFLATRGYAVFQPNFRGSSGFGRRFAEAGYRGWGGIMQDDVEDGVQSLIDAGVVDASRMCVFGASYGGYVALQAGASQPDRYRCIASFSGVSDLRASMIWEGQAYGYDSEHYRYWLKNMGDPATMGERLKETSPITYAERFRAPVLLVHGEWDTNVLAAQSEAMERALRRAGKPVKLVILKQEGHGNWRDVNHRLALSELETFLRANLGPGVGGAPAVQTAAAPTTP